MCLFKKWKKLKAERDFYKGKYIEETDYTAKLKSQQRQTESELQKLRDESEALRLENKKLCDERLAMRNIIEDERRKNKKKAETMQSRINRLNQDLERLKDKKDPLFGQQ